MEGGIVWLIILVGWVLFNIFGKSDEEKTYEARKEIFDKIRLQLNVSEEIPPKERGLPNMKLIAVKVKGLFGNPNEDKTKVFLTIHDNTDLGDDEFGLPILSAHPSFSEQGSRVFTINVQYTILVLILIFLIGLVLFIFQKNYCCLLKKEEED